MNFDRYIRCAIATVALAATAVLSSCSRDDSQNGAVPAKSNVSVGFRISLGEPANPSTRSVEYDDGKSTDYENYIDFRNYRVMFFDKSNPLSRRIQTDRYYSARRQSAAVAPLRGYRQD